MRFRPGLDDDRSPRELGAPHTQAELMCPRWNGAQTQRLTDRHRMPSHPVVRYQRQQNCGPPCEPSRPLGPSNVPTSAPTSSMTTSDSSVVKARHSVNSPALSSTRVESWEAGRFQLLLSLRDRRRRRCLAPTTHSRLGESPARGPLPLGAGRKVAEPPKSCRRAKPLLAAG